MQKPIEHSVKKLFTQADKAADGCRLDEQTINILHNTESAVREDLANARDLDQEYQASKSARKAAVAAQTTADGNATVFLATARDVLKPHLGAKWSEDWAEAGFINHSIAIPDTIDQRMELVKSMELYFTAHPALEVAPLNVTAARAATLHTALSDAVSAANNAWKVQGVCAASRADAVRTLQERLRGLIKELSQLIGPDDPRWLDFGFNIPSAEPTPEVPEGLIVRGGASGHLVADWVHTPRATHYHVYKQLVDEGGDFVLAKTVTDSDADLNTFTPGARVRVMVTALNSNRESIPTEPVEHVVP